MGVWYGPQGLPGSFPDCYQRKLRSRGGSTWVLGIKVFLCPFLNSLRAVLLSLLPILRPVPSLVSQLSLVQYHSFNSFAFLSVQHSRSFPFFQDEVPCRPTYHLHGSPRKSSILRPINMAPKRLHGDENPRCRQDKLNHPVPHRRLRRHPQLHRSRLDRQLPPQHPPTNGP